MSCLPPEEGEAYTHVNMSCLPPEEGEEYKHVNMSCLPPFKIMSDSPCPPFKMAAVAKNRIFFNCPLLLYYKPN